MIRFRLLGLALAVALASVAPRGSGAAVFSPESVTLKNGLQVVVIANHRAPIVIQMVWYKVGAADEPLGKSGIAHFLEHLMFKGTKDVPPGEFSKIVAANGGQDNAFTSQDYTAYFQRVARDRLELVMKLESDRMTNLTLTDAEVLPERDVVLEERRSRTDNSPAAQLYEQTQAALYMRHPYGNPVIGWRDEIAALTTKDALDFYRAHYAPNNAVLIVAGDVTMEQVRPLAEKYYGIIPRREVPPRVRLSEPPHKAARRLKMESPRVRQPSWSRSYLAPSFRNDPKREALALQVLAEILGGGTTGRLYRALVVEQKLAASAGAWYSGTSYDYGGFGFSATPRAGVGIDKLEKAVSAEIANVVARGVTREEVKSAINSLSAGAIYARDSLRAGPNIIGQALTTGRSIRDVEEWPDRITRLTREDINRAARRVLNSDNSVTSVLLPSRKSG